MKETRKKTGEPRTIPDCRIKQVLVPVDFSDCSTEALRYAAAVAAKFGAGLSVLHVVEPWHADWRMDTLAFQRRLHTEALRRLRQIVADELRGVGQVHAKLHGGHPVGTIVDFARRSKADLIIMGSHGRGGVKRALIGSVAERVVRHAPCPVLVVR